MKRQDWLILLMMLATLIGVTAWNQARAQTPPLVVICQSSWGSSSPVNGKLGGCAAYVDATKPAIYFGVPNANSLVYTDASDQWTKCGALASTANVYTAQNKSQWDDASVTTGLTKTPVGALCGGSPIPSPPTPPSPPTLGTCNANACVFNWTASATDTNNKPETDTGYILTIDGNDTTIPAILTYAATGLSLGNHVAMLRAINADGISDYTTPYPFTVVTSDPVPIPTPTPIPTPAPQPTVTVVEVLGTWILKRGTANVQTGLVDYAACKALAMSKATTTAVKYTCNVSNAVAVKQWKTIIATSSLVVLDTKP